MSNTPQLKILMIEDNPGFARLIYHLLAEEPDCPWEIKNVQSFKEGMQCLAQENFSAVVLDLYLPDSDGLESLHKIKEKNAAIPIVYLTALDDPKMRLSAIEKGARGYLLKDQVTGSLFAKTIREAVSISERSSSSEKKSIH